jgi:hypothetical protein
MPDLNYEQFLIENPSKIDKQEIINEINKLPKQLVQRTKIPLIVLYDLWD